MIRALRTAALGMSAQQMNVDVVANNLANVNTTGFKKSAVEFQDLLYDTIKSGNDDAAREMKKPGEIQVGMGNRPIATFRSFTQGNVEETGNSLDLAINGNGFFQIQQTDGTIAYTRDGSFRVNADGELVTGSGLRVYPQLDIPLGAASVSVSENGVISVLFPNQPDPEEVGQLELASFMNPAGLRAEGGNLYVETQASGRPNFGIPGEDSYGQVVQGYLEKSNVDVVQEMINLIVSQRAYEINSKAVTTADELLSITNNIKR